MSAFTLRPHTLRAEYEAEARPMLIWVATLVIWVSTLKDVAIAGFNPLWFGLRLGYLPYMLAVFAAARRLGSLGGRAYEFPLWAAGAYVTVLCSVVATQSGYLASHATLGLVLLYLAGAMLPITRRSYVGITSLSLASYVGACIARGGIQVLRDRVAISAAIPFLAFAYLAFFVISRIRAAKLATQSRLAELTAQVSHDIRSPLSALESAIRLLPEIGDDQRALLQGVAGRIRRIADDLEGPAARVGAEAGPELRALIEAIVGEKKLQYAERAELEIACELRASPRLPSALAASELARVLSNLINNAAEAIAGSGRITVRLEAVAGGARVTVHDTGSGIAPGVLPRLLQRGATFGKAGGSGLGLAHACETLEAVGGRVELRSELGVGTEVVLEIPS
jgi:signal transduction histidine kinase